jgi:hypothetical protein
LAIDLGPFSSSAAIEVVYWTVPSRRPTLALMQHNTDRDGTVTSTVEGHRAPIGVDSGLPHWDAARDDKHGTLLTWVIAGAALGALLSALLDGRSFHHGPVFIPYGAFLALTAYMSRTKTRLTSW